MLLASKLFSRGIAALLTLNLKKKLNAFAHFGGSDGLLLPCGAWNGSSCCGGSLFRPTARLLAKTDVNSASFELEVLQSSIPALLVFVNAQANRCNNFVASLEKLCDAMNAETGARWLKLCVIDADVNKNLASAFAVERAKLPVTFFLFAASIVDRVDGAVPLDRAQGILLRFREYYESKSGVDLSTEHEGNKGTGISVAGKIDLTAGASTSSLRAKCDEFLRGRSMLLLPQQKEVFDTTLKDLVRRAKKQAHSDLEELHKKLEMDVRRYTQEELLEQYYKTDVFIEYATISALELLYLTRCATVIMDFDLRVAMDSLVEYEKEFSVVLGDTTVREIHGLAELCILKARCRAALKTASVDDSKELLEEHRFHSKIIKWVDAVDSTAPPTDIPKDIVEEIFTEIRRRIPLSKKSGEVGAKAKEEMKMMQQALVSLLKQFTHSDEARAARARLTNLLY